MDKIEDGYYAGTITTMYTDAIGFKTQGFVPAQDPPHEGFHTKIKVLNLPPIFARLMRLMRKEALVVIHVSSNAIVSVMEEQTPEVTVPD